MTAQDALPRNCLYLEELASSHDPTNSARIHFAACVISQVRSKERSQPTGQFSLSSGLRVGTHFSFLSMLKQNLKGDLKKHYQNRKLTVDM